MNAFECSFAVLRAMRISPANKEHRIDLISGGIHATGFQNAEITRNVDGSLGSGRSTMSKNLITVQMLKGMTC